MRYTTYSKHIPELLDAINFQELPGPAERFPAPVGVRRRIATITPIGVRRRGRRRPLLDALRDAIVRALMESGKLSKRMLQILRGDSDR